MIASPVERDGLLEGSLEKVVKEMDTSPGELPRYTHFAAPRAVARAELEKRQPFLFHTEMNDCLPPQVKSPITP